MGLEGVHVSGSLASDLTSAKSHVGEWCLTTPHADGRIRLCIVRQYRWTTDRRALFGLVGASTLVLGSGPSVLAGETPGIERKVSKEVDSTIPGDTEIGVRHIIGQPGATLPENTMHNAMICECADGSFEVTNEG
jgi:hypothetical protein